MTPSRISFLSRTERTWFWISMGISLGLILVYIGIHWLSQSESEIHFLSKEELSISTALLDPDTLDKEEENIKDLLIDYLSLILDIKVPKDKESDGKDSISARQIIADNLDAYSISQLKIVLPTMPFEVESYFWLTGPWSILEIIFWSLFGLMASVLYRVSEAISKKEFDIRKTPIQIAKIIYAPLSAIIIIFSVNALTTNNGNPFEKIDYSLIVFSFILGFFSGRTVELLKRLKDIILPLGGTEESVSSTAINTYQMQGRLGIGQLTDPPVNVEWNKVRLTAQLLDKKEQKEIDAEVSSNGQFSFPLLTEGQYLLTARYSTATRNFSKQQLITVNPEIEKREVEVILNELNDEQKV